MMTGTEVRAEIGRRATARLKVLAALLEAGPRGCTNDELNAICFRYGARIHELRAEWAIARVGGVGGRYRYILAGRREPRQEALFA